MYAIVWTCRFHESDFDPLILQDTEFSRGSTNACASTQDLSRTFTVRATLVPTNKAGQITGIQSLIGIMRAAFCIG